MKKIWIAAVSLLLCAAMIIFAGCSGLEKGKIDGNYKEPTQEELQSTLASLEGKSMIGDPQEEGWEFGFNAGGNFEETIDLNGKQFTLKASVSYSLNLVKGEQAVVPEGKGDLSFEMKSDLDEKSESASVDVTIYNDADYFYIDGTAKEGDSSSELKIKTALGDIFDILPDAELPDQTFTPDTEYSFDADLLLSLADQFKMKLETDTGDGVKFRLSATDETSGILMTKLFGILGSSLQIPGLSDVFAVTDNTFELYLHIGSDGRFSAAAGNINLKGSLDLSSLVNSDNAKYSIETKGSAFIQYKINKISLPEGIAQDPSYKQSSDSGLFPIA